MNELVLFYPKWEKWVEIAERVAVGHENCFYGIFLVAKITLVDLKILSAVYQIAVNKNGVGSRRGL